MQSERDVSRDEQDLATGEATAADGALDPAQQLRLVAETRARTHRALVPDERVVFGAWGVAWFVGFGVFWLSSPLRDGGPLVALPGLFDGLLFFALLVAAGFAMLPCIVLSAERLGAPPEATALMWPALSGLVVGLLYIGGAAVWDEPHQFVIGAWIIGTTGVGCLLGRLPLYLVMSLAGGGGFLAAAGWSALRRYRLATPVPA